jgi:hypothetical protein
MKNLFLVSFCALFTFISKAQTVSTFESLSLSKDSFWDGISQPLGSSFSNGNAIFPNYFDTSYGGFWTGGWAYSNMTDTITPDYNNIYSARPGKGYKGSNNFAIGQQNSMIKLTGAASGKIVEGFYITNSTYASYSIKDGDFVSKKFGGITRKDKDFFKLKIQKYYGGVLTNDSVVFYLADYRSDDSTNDYIVKDWRWVNLTSLGNVDSLTFELISSDNGQFGMNTPAFFCMDNFTTRNNGLNIAEEQLTNTISASPNPVHDLLTIYNNNLTSTNYTVQITDQLGRIITTIEANSNTIQLNVANWANGIYIITTCDNNLVSTQRFIKA